MTDKTDLLSAYTPDQIPDMLRRIAQRFAEDAGELQSTWQDRHAGTPWARIATELERAADKIEKDIGRA